ncbi:hypothetical protein M422DRAFT_129418, partial [Sphaerobolus stellatus SS14]
HLTTIFSGNVTQMEHLLPEVTETWGKVQIKDKGDCIRTAAVRVNQTGQDQSFIKYRQYIDLNSRFARQDEQMVPKWYYGQLILILVCTLPGHPLFRNRAPRRAFVLVKPCVMNGHDASLGNVSYTEFRPQSIIDLAAISCVVGRVQIGNNGRWCIIDR